MKKKAHKQKDYKPFYLKNKLFLSLIFLTTIFYLGFFLLPFLFRSNSQDESVPLLSYAAIIFYFFCFWLFDKRTERKK